MKILFLAYTSQKYDGHGIRIDRPDLTRKMSCLETWVPRVEEKGHEVIFFDGGYDSIYYDKKNKVLHTDADDRYDYDYLKDQGIGSLMLVRLQTAIKWALENVEFDYIFRTDDGSYINAFLLDSIIKTITGYDVIKGYKGGGGGMFFSKKTCELLIQYDNIDRIHIEDLALYKFFKENPSLKILNIDLLCNQYILSEDYFSIHYTNGKRQYTVDNAISYYDNNTPIDRKVIVNYNLDYLTSLKCNTWDSNWQITPIYYSFDKDKYNWEHYGILARSSYFCNLKCPFAKNSIKELFLYETFFNFEDEQQHSVFKKYLKSIKPEGHMYLYYKDSNIDLKMLDYANIVTESKIIDLEIEHINKQPGNFYKLKVI